MAQVGSARLRSGSRALGRSVRPTVWNALVLSALVLVAAAASAVPLFRAATDQAALADALTGVAPGAQAADAPVVQIVSGVGPKVPAGSLMLTAAGTIRGLTEPVVLGQSAAPDLRKRGFDPPLTPVVVAGDRTANVRLVAVDDPAAHLRVVGPTAGAGGGVWLPVDVARRLAVRAGDVVDVGTLEQRLPGEPPERHTVPLTLRGVYETDASRHPVGPPGDQVWAASGFRLPTDTATPSVPAFLVVTDLATASRIVPDIRETLLWSSVSALDPAVPLLDDALRIREAVLDLDSRAAQLTNAQQGAIGTDVVSGIPDLVGVADGIATTVRSTTAGQAWAGVALALGVVLGLALVGAGRRETELRAVAGLGRHPLVTATGTTAALLPLAAVAVPLGVLLARSGAGQVHPLPPTSALLRTAAGYALLAVTAGLGLVLVATWAAAVAAGRPGRAGAVVRRRPWPWLLAAGASAAAAGVLTRPPTDRAVGLDVLAPVLVVAAVAALGARLLARSAQALAARLAGPDRGGRRVPAGVLLALRRSGRGAGGGPAVVTAFAFGLGLLFFGMTTSAAVEAAAADKAAVVAGTAARACLDGSWVLDPDAPERPREGPNLPRPQKPPVTTPPVPDGSTIVWRSQGLLTTTGDLPALLAVDPVGFERAARWGGSAELAAGREGLHLLAREQAARQETLDFAGDTAAVPMLLVGQARARVGDRVVVQAGNLTFLAEIVGAVAAFPGLAPRDTMAVIPAESLFTVVGLDDPRLRGNVGSPPIEVWSRDGVAGLQRILDPVGATAQRVVTVEQAEATPSLVAARRTSGYRFLLGVLAAAIAVAVLCAGVDRTLVQGRAEDVLLARVGLGRLGVGRARVLETAVLVAVGAVLAVVGTAAAVLVARRSVDPDPLLAPRLTVAPDARAAAVLLVAAVASWLMTVAVIARRTTADDEAEVIRDAR